MRVFFLSPFPDTQLLVQVCVAVFPLFMTDSLLSGTLHTAYLRPVNKNLAFVINVVEIDCYGSDWGLNIQTRYGYGRAQRRLVNAVLVWTMGTHAGDRGHIPLLGETGRTPYVV